MSKKTQILGQEKLTAKDLLRLIASEINEEIDYMVSLRKEGEITANEQSAKEASCENIGTGIYGMVKGTNLEVEFEEWCNECGLNKVDKRIKMLTEKRRLETWAIKCNEEEIKEAMKSYAELRELRREPKAEKKKKWERMKK